MPLPNRTNTRFLTALAIILLMAAPARAIQAPSQQFHLDHGKMLRGDFTEERHMTGIQDPLRISGTFIANPATGLVWNVEKPFPTTTTVTPESMYQRVGSLKIRLPVKNLKHLYDMIGGALAGDWGGLEKDFVIKQDLMGSQWNMTLTPRANINFAYNVITITGGRFVEKIFLTKSDGSSDSFTFSNASISQP